MLIEQAKVPVLSLSQRTIADLVAYCSNYEFEDSFAALTDATRIDSTNFRSLEFSRRCYKLAYLIGLPPKLSRSLAPQPRGARFLERDYEFFFPTFNHSYELYSLATVPNWRQRSKKAACFILEIWSDMLPRYLVDLLKDFDHIFLGCRNSVEDVARMTGRPCTFLPLAADVLRFAPNSIDDERPIDVSYIGRRSQVTHRALIEYARCQELFYFYDTVSASGSDMSNRTFRVDNPAEHRLLLASILKRSRYFFANRSYVNRPEFTAGREEISTRFYEGIASGAVVIGVPPRSADFRDQFDWPDAAIHVPFDSPDIGSILTDLDANPARLRAVRYNNVRNAAMKHDWLHRIQTVFDILQLPYTSKMHARALRLDRLAKSIPVS
jgi:hypothetical protein